MVSGLIIGILFFLTAANLIFLWLLYRDVLQKMSEYDKKLAEMQLETNITEAFTTDDTSHEDLNKLANKLFADVKKTFGLEGNTFSEFVELLKTRQVKNPKLKEALIHFFDKIIIYSYRDVSISETDRDQLKQEYKLIQQMIDEHITEKKK